MGEIAAQWVSVGDRFYQRTEIYGEAWAKQLASFERFTPAPYGGPILVVHDNSEIHVHQASGQRISQWKWRSAATSRIVACDWSHCEEAVFVLDDGNVLMYSLFGELVKTTSMGQEAKDLKVKDAKVFRTISGTTGVAILTNSNRFFVVNNLSEPRVRKMCDVVDWPNVGYVPPWAVLASERHAKIVMALLNSDPIIITQTDIFRPIVDTVPFEKREVRHLVVASDNAHLAICYDDGLLWMGNLEEEKLCHVKLEPETFRSCSSVVWCGLDSIVCLTAVETSQCLIVSTSAATEETFLPGFISAVQEIDGARIFSVYSMEMLQCVSPSLEKVYSIGSVRPGAQLRLAAEKFFVEHSHEADEYMRNIREVLPEAVEDCIEAAGLLHDPEHQKDLMRSAQFGKSFLPSGGLGSVGVSADAFANMCKTLRVLNAVRHYRVGMPLTIAQYRRLTARVVVDRLLARRLYPLAMNICQFLSLPAPLGANRVLAHWACYKVSCNDDDANIARSIYSRLGHNKPQIPYCDIAAKAAECGKKDLSIKLLEHEVSVAKQVPLLVQLEEESSALSKALASGDRDLAFSVILHLRKKLSSTDFHMMIRKYPLGKILYQNYCRQHDQDALLDFYVQEDDFSSQACHQFQLAYGASRCETRQAVLVNVQELYHKSKNEALASLAEENWRLLKSQSFLEEKLGKSFVGLSLHQTLEDLIQMDEMKFAEKVRTDFKITDRRFTWIKAKTLARSGKWNDLKKLAKTKKLPMSVRNIVKLARKHGGEDAAKIFLTDEFLNNEDKFILTVKKFPKTMFAQLWQIVFASLFLAQVYGQAVCRCTCSSWMNRDNPGGLGDYELTDSQSNPAKPCPSNYYVQARVVGTSKLYNSQNEIGTDLGQVVRFVVNKNSRYGVGMYCQNADNTVPCKDYEARFCCAGDDAGTGCSVWMNRDLPSGDGDWELTDANTNPTKAAKYVVQAQRVGYTQRYNSPQEVLAALGQTVTLSVNSYAALGVGMYCRNHLNPTRGCMDYRARFCCACTT